MSDSSPETKDKMLRELAASVVGQDQCTDEYPIACIELYEALPGNAKEMLRQLFLQGPVWDGNCVSKAGRSVLFELGLASRAIVKGECGYTVTNYTGGDVYRTWSRRNAPR